MCSQAEGRLALTNVSRREQCSAIDPQTVDCHEQPKEVERAK